MRSMLSGGSCCCPLAGAFEPRNRRLTCSSPPNGRDDNPGTAERPFATVGRAKQAVAEQIGGA
jgi:hypothetical protein